MKKWIFRLIFAALSIAFSHNAVAQTRSAEYQRLLNEAIELEHTSDLLYKTFLPAFEKNLVSTGVITSYANQQLSEELADAFAPILNDMIKELWSKTFTLEEMRQIVEWLSSTPGQKMVMLSAEITSYSEKMVQDPANQALMERILTKYIGR